MKVGLITYHSAYNFGSVLQAYATQTIVEEIAGNCEIINYRTDEQKRVYSIFVWSKGWRFLITLANNILILSKLSEKKRRACSYETLFREIFNLSEECSEPDEVYHMWNKYDLIISGSDQIWNKHSKELHYVSWDYMMPYLLKGYKGRKISYASSIAHMDDEEIKKILPYIQKFDAVSFREKSSAQKIAQLCDLKISNVLDPTFLLSKNDWISRFNLSISKGEKYILFYALNRRRDIKKNLATIEEYSKRRGLKVKMITPLGFFKKTKNIEMLEEVGPKEFLNLIYNAESIITDSYHGTILSVNFQKDIFSICGRNPSDFRKTDILDRIGLHERIITNMGDLLNRKFDPINYNKVGEEILRLKEQSLDYLKNALYS